MRRPQVIVASVACILAGAAAGMMVRAGAQSTNLAMNPGDTAHVTCAGPSLSVVNQTPAALDLACAPNPSTTTTIASTTTTGGSTTTTGPSGSVVSEDQLARGFNVSSVTVTVTNTAPEVVVAWVSADTNGAGQTVAVSGGGLSWTLAGRSDAQLGTAEVWWATTSGKNLAVTATPAQSGKNIQLTVVTYLGASKIGAVKSASASSGPPTVSLTPQASGSLVGAVGFDWDNAINRTVPSGQTIDAQNTDSAGDTYWAQHVNAAAVAGYPVTVNDTLPATDRWDMEVVEVVPASGPPPTTTTTMASSTTTTAPSATTTTTGSNTAPAVDASTPAATTIANNVISVTSGSFSPPAGTVVYAAFSMDSLPGSGAAVTTITDSGTPLAWHLMARENHTDGSSVGGFVEVWWAYNATAQTAISVSGSFNVPSKNVTPPVGYLQTLVMNHAAADQTSAAWTPTWDVGNGSVPTAGLTTTAGNSLVLGVFDNWDSSVNPSPGANQTTTVNGRHAVVLNPTDQDTYWLQAQTAPTPNAGTLVTMNDTAPSVRYHEIAWEVLAG